MLELKIEDVDMRYMAFTLDSVAKDLEVEKGTARRLLTSMHLSLKGYVNSKNHFLEFLTYDAIQEAGTNAMKEFIEAELIEASDNEITEDSCFFLTEKAISLLTATAEKQRDMKESGFSYCGGIYIVDPSPLYSNIRERL